MEEYEITCTAYAYGGTALGRLPDGRTVFVPFALPGERVRVRLRKQKAGYAEAELCAVLTPSPERVAPRCRHFGQCGGCHYQHMSYVAQLAAKQQILRDQLVRLGGLVDPPVAPTVPSPQAWGYRNHMQFHRMADGRLGFQAARSDQTIPITECHLPELALDAAWRQLEQHPAKQRPHGKRQRGQTHPERVSLRVGAGNQLQRADGSPISIDIFGQRFRVSAASFFQVNTPMAEQLVTHVLAQLPATGLETAIDVYCGVGLFSRFLAPHVGQLIGIESSPAACADFAHNLAGFDHVTLHEATAEAALAQLAEPVEFMVADPPRAGLGKPVIEQLLRLKPGRMVYVSCDPATLARDARLLIEGGYQLASVTPFDLFPQTYHIESVSVWVR
jgi:23S rRNA (uracil1939-C5)-methyltransferase